MTLEHDMAMSIFCSYPFLLSIPVQTSFISPRCLSLCSKVSRLTLQHTYIHVPYIHVPYDPSVPVDHKIMTLEQNMAASISCSTDHNLFKQASYRPGVFSFFSVQIDPPTYSRSPMALPYLWSIRLWHWNRICPCPPVLLSIPVQTSFISPRCRFNQFSCTSE